MNDNYVFLNEKLLPVLTPEEEKELLSKKEQPEAMEALIEHNLRLVVFITKKYQNTKVEMNDLISIGTIGLIKAIRSYSTEKSTKLATYASKCIMNEILMYLRKNMKHSNVQHLSDEIFIDENGGKLKIEDTLFDERKIIDNTEEQEMLEIISNTLTIALNKLELREKRILLLNLAGKKQSEICKQFNVSQSYVSRIQKKIKVKIQQFAKNNINEEAHLKFVFLFTENNYEFGISLKEYSDLESKLSTIEKTLKEVFKEEYNSVIKNKKDGYLFFVFSKQEESFIFISEMLKWFDTPKVG